MIYIEFKGSDCFFLLLPDARAATRGHAIKDLTIILESRPGALADLGEALGRAGVSVEGGGAWVVGAQGVAHFLFADGTAARRALEGAGIHALAEREALVQRLKQNVPSQLGLLTRRWLKLASTSKSCTVTMIIGWSLS